MVTDDERTAIRLASATYRWPAVRDQHVRDQLGMSPWRFRQYVGALIVRPDVIAELPAECARLRRLREARRRERRAG